MTLLLLVALIVLCLASLANILILTVIFRSLTAMSETLATLQQKIDDNTQQLTTLQTTVDTVQGEAATAFADLATEVQSLKEQLAQGTPITQADLDALGASLDTQAAAIAAITQDVTDTPIPPDNTPPVF